MHSTTQGMDVLVVQGMEVPVEIWHQQLGYDALMCSQLLNRLSIPQNNGITSKVVKGING